MYEKQYRPKEISFEFILQDEEAVCYNLIVNIGKVFMVKTEYLVDDL